MNRKVSQPSVAKLDAVGRSLLSSVQHATAGGASSLLQDISKGFHFDLFLIEWFVALNFISTVPQELFSDQINCVVNDK